MDIKELRINNSVLARGECVKVEAIGNNEVAGLNIIASPEGKTMIFYGDEIEPIPITEELLKELRFEEEKEPEEGWYYGIEKVFMKDFINDDGLLDFVSLAQFEGGLYQLQVLGTLAYVRYLHTLQNFVFMTTKQELI